MSVGANTVNALIGSVSDLVFNSTSTAAANTAALQAALNRGGVVRVRGSGSLWLTDSLTLYSNTTFLRDAGVLFKMLAGIGGKPVLQNYAFTQRAGTTVTLSWSSGTTASVSNWVGHGCIVGDYVWFQGATLSVYNTIAYVTAANSAAGTMTVQLMRVPTGAVSGTIKAVKCDRNITIEGGVLDYNYPSNTTGLATLNANAVNIGVVQNLTVRGVVSNDAEKYSFMFGAVRDFHIEDCGADISNSDLVKVLGPAINGRVVNTWGVCADDGVSVQTRVPSAYPNFQWTNGDVIDVHIDGTDITQSAGLGIACCYPSSAELMTGVKMSRIGGVTAGNAIATHGENSSSDVVDSLEIDNVTASCLRGFYGLGTTGGGTSINRLVMRNHTPRVTQDTGLYISTTSTFTIVDADCDVRVHDSAFGGNARQYAIETNGPVRRARFSGSVIAGSNGRFFRPIAGAASANGLFIVSVEQRTGDAVAAIDTGAATGATIVFEDCDTTTAALIVPAVSCSLVFRGGNKFHNASNAVVRTTGTPTISVQSDGANILTGTSVWFAAPSGTPVINPYGWDIRVDPIAVVGMGTAAGQFCTSTQASTEGGPCIYGPAGWVALGTGASGINTVIT